MQPDEMTTLYMRPVVFDQTFAGKFDEALHNLDAEVRLICKERKIAFRKVRRELSGTPTNMVAIYKVPAAVLGKAHG